MNRVSDHLLHPVERLDTQSPVGVGRCQHCSLLLQLRQRLLDAGSTQLTPVLRVSHSASRLAALQTVTCGSAAQGPAAALVSPRPETLELGSRLETGP